MLRYISQNTGMHLLVQFVEKGYNLRIKPAIRSVLHQLEERQVLQRVYNSGLKWEHRLLMGALVIIFGILLLATKIYQNNLINLSTHERIEYSSQVLVEIEQVSTAVKDLELGVRGYVLTRNISFLGPFYSTRQTIFSKLKNLKSISSASPAQLSRLEAFQKLLTQKLVYLETAIRLANSSQARAGNYIRDNVDFNSIRQIENLLADMKAEEYQKLARRKDDYVSGNEIYTRLNLILAATLIGLVLATYYLLWRSRRATAKARHQIESGKHLLQAIIDNSSSAIYVKDIFGRITIMNRQFQEIYGQLGVGLDASPDDKILETGMPQESQEKPAAE